MRKSDKILLSFVSLIGIGIAVIFFFLFYTLPYIQLIPLANYGLMGASVFIGFCFFILLCFVITSTNLSHFMIIASEKGDIQVSRKTIESTALYSILDLRQIASSDFSAKVNKNPVKTKLYVKLYVNDYNDIAILTKEAQNRIDNALKSSLEVDIKSITLRVIDISASNKTKKNSNNNSRVT